MHEKNDDDQARVGPSVPCVAPAGSTAERQTGAVTADERPDDQLVLAEGIAWQAHAGQKERSTGDPYIKHIKRVVQIVREHMIGSHLRQQAEAVAWLHDVLEDCPEQYTAESLRRAGISRAVVDAVVELTRVPDQPYEHYITDIHLSGNVLARAVKIADLIDHLRPNCPPSLRPRYELALQTLVQHPVHGVVAAVRRAHEDSSSLPSSNERSNTHLVDNTGLPSAAPHPARTEEP